MSSGLQAIEGFEKAPSEKGAFASIFQRKDGSSAVPGTGYVRNGSKRSARFDNHTVYEVSGGLFGLTGVEQWFHGDLTVTNWNGTDDWTIFGLGYWNPAIKIFAVGAGFDAFTRWILYKIDYTTHNGYSMINPEITQLAAGPALAAGNTYQFDIKTVEDDGGAGKHGIYVYINNSVSPDMSHNTSDDIWWGGNKWGIHQWMAEEGKGGPALSSTVDNCIYTGRQQYTQMNGRCSGTNWGVAPAVGMAGVIGKENWTPSPALVGDDHNYGHLDDKNQSDAPVADDHLYIAMTDETTEEGFAFYDEESGGHVPFGAGTVDGVALHGEIYRSSTPAVGTGGRLFTAGRYCFLDGATKHGADYPAEQGFSTNDVSAEYVLLPQADAQDWSRAIFNTLQVFKKNINYEGDGFNRQIYQYMAQVAGTGLSVPTAGDNENASVASICPIVGRAYSQASVI